jgi:putative tricarboxylic transport membrane protein
MTRSDSITNLIVIALGLFVAYHSYAVLKLGILISPGAGFLPFLCGIALIVLGVVWRLQGWLFRPGPKASAGEAEAASLPGTRRKLVLAFLTTTAYALLFERIGFLLSTLVFMLGWQMVVERERWLKAVIVTALCAAAMYGLFRYLLRVELPPNPFLA